MFHLPLNPSLSYTATFTDPIILNPYNGTFLEKPFHVPNYLPRDHTLSPTHHTILSPSEQYENQNKCHDIANNPLNYEPSIRDTGKVVLLDYQANKYERKPEKKKASDRHSKIAVKNRLRHRRTRLSIEVARQLFELQDMLKFERASKAVEWLLLRARSDIMKLKQDLHSTCSVVSTTSPNNSECEIVNSGLDDVAAEDKKKNKHRRSSKTRRGSYNPLSKEVRELARKRARERTLKKRTQKPSWPSIDSAAFSGQPQQACVNTLMLPDDLFQDIGMSFEMATN